MADKVKRNNVLKQGFQFFRIIQVVFCKVLFMDFNKHRFLEAAGAVLKIGSSLKPNHQREI